MKLKFTSIVPVIAPAISIRVAVVMLLCSGFAQQSAAKPTIDVNADRGVHPYASVGTTWDDNLFRVKDSAEALSLLGTTDMSDRYTTLEAGVKVGLTASRQNFLINGRINNNNYNTFNFLDYTGGGLEALWDWTRGDIMSGKLGYVFDRRLRSFLYQVTPQKDIRTENTIYGTADRWLTDRWRLGVLGNWTKLSFDKSKPLDRDVQEGGVGIDYITPLRNSIGFQATVANADYTNKNSSDYKEYVAGPKADWQLAGKTRLLAEAGYLSRQYDDNIAAGQEDVSGFSGRVTVIWDAYDSLKIKAAAYRRIGNIGDEVDSYAVISGINIEPTWQATSKISLRAQVVSDRYDYKGLSVPQREDDYKSAGAWLDWKFYRNVGVSLGYVDEKRTSNQPSQEYKSQVVQALFNVGF